MLTRSWPDHGILPRRVGRARHALTVRLCEDVLDQASLHQGVSGPDRQRRQDEESQSDHDGIAGHPLRCGERRRPQRAIPRDDYDRPGESDDGQHHCHHSEGLGLERPVQKVSLSGEEHVAGPDEHAGRDRERCQRELAATGGQQRDSRKDRAEDGEADDLEQRAWHRAIPLPPRSICRPSCLVRGDALSAGTALSAGDGDSSGVGGRWSDIVRTPYRPTRTQPGT